MYVLVMTIGGVYIHKLCTIFYIKWSVLYLG